MPEESAPLTPSPPGPTPAGFQRTTGGKGFRWQPPTPQKLAELLPQYEIECMLGHGGMGAVYKGRQKSLERTVAIKILPPGLEHDDDGSYIERFKNEAKVMAKFMHPAIVGVFDFGETAEGQLYIVMEYVNGTDVQKMISSQGKLPPEHALAITAHVCDALKYAHEHGVIHRDIKPANILINQEGAVKVADFGLAKAEEAGSSGLTKTGTAMGTPDYVAPEALMLGTEVDGRADLYAVGVMLYQMLTGQIPRGAWQPASVLSPGTDRRFDQIITKAMQYDREARYQSSGEIRRALDAILSAPQLQSGAPSSATPPQQKPAGRPLERKNVGAPAPKSKTPLFIGIGAAALLGIGSFVMFGGKKAPGKVASTPTAASSKAAVAEASAPPVAAPPKTTQTDPAKSGGAQKPAASKTSLSPSSEPWQDALQDPKKLTLSGDIQQTAEGLRLSGTGVVKYYAENGTSQRDGAVRMLSTFGSDYPSLFARDGEDKTGSYRLWAVQSRILLMRYVAATKQMLSLREFPLRESLQPGQNYELELRAVGKTITVKYNGDVLGSVTDETHSEGSFGVLLNSKNSTPVVVQTLEVLNLDAPTKPVEVTAAPTAAVSKTTTRREWQPLEWEARYHAPLEASLKDGWHHLTDQFTTVAEQQSPQVKQMTSRAFRCKARIADGAGIRLEQHNFYVGNHNSKKAVIRHFTPSGQITLAEADLAPPVTPDKEIWIELATCGQMLVARFDGKLLGPVRDENITPRSHLSIGGKDAWFKDVQYRDLSGMSEAEVLKLFDVDENGHDTRGVVAQAPAKGTEPAQNAEAAKVMEQEKAGEQPQPPAADAVKAIPELQTLHEQFLKLTAERVATPFEADLAKLNAGYIGGIDRKIAEETAAGHLDGVIALEAEKKLLADKQPVPANDAETTSATLKALRGIYRAAYAKIDSARLANLKQLTDPLSTRLQALESELTKQKRIPDAKTVREYREKMAEGNAAIADKNASAGGEVAKTPVAGKSASAPTPDASTKYPRGDDRKAAEWVISMGGKVTVSANGTSTEVTAVADLPRGKFTVQKVSLRPPNQPLADLLPLAGLKELTELDISKETSLDDADMDVLTSLPALTKFNFEFGNLTDAAFTTLAKLRSLNFLNLREQRGMTGEALSMLAKLNLTDLNLQGCRFTDAGFKNLGLLTQLTRLTLQQSNFRDEHLVFLEPLKKLDEVNFSDEVTATGLARSKGWPNLTKLALTLVPGGADQFRGIAAKFPKVSRITNHGRRDKPLAPQDIAVLAGFPKLTDLAMQEMTDEGMPALLELPEVSFISISYSSITDAGLAALVPHKGLRRLEIQNNFGKVEITDAGLLKLAEMKKLTFIKVSSPKISKDGVLALRKLRPDLAVEQ